jgi:predicted XRE-type DNA-binding protein
MSAQTLLLPAHPHPIPLIQARETLPTAEFRIRLRESLLATPQVTLVQVANQLGVSRQAVNQLVGKLDRPTCAHPNRPAPKREAARARMKELERRVAAGELAKTVAAELGISMNAALRLGFRAKSIRPAHGHGRKDCNCWRCRRAVGVTKLRGRRANERELAETLDWLAWTDPDDDTALTQARISELTGVWQSMVSRIARASE